MEILIYQAFIIVTLALVRLVNPRHVKTACWIWSGLTVFNLIFWPLIFVQLVVIWTTYAALTTKTQSKSSVDVSTSQSSTKASVSPATAYIKDSSEGPKKSFLAEVNNQIAWNLAIQNSTRKIKEAVNHEKLLIDSALQSAHSTIAQKKELATKSPELLELYEAGYKRISLLLQEREKETPIVLKPPDFTLPPRHANGEIADSVERIILELKAERAAYLRQVSTSLANDPELKKYFNRKLEDQQAILLLVSKAPTRSPFDALLRQKNYEIDAGEGKYPIRAIGEADSVQKIAEKRNIPYLVHFTRAQNLPSILRHGIYSLDLAKENALNPVTNDSMRLDGRTGTISTSISFPNASMFYKYREENPDEEWVMLLVDSEVLWKQRCAFCQHNAADKRISRKPISDLMLSTAFEAMFDDDGSDYSREDQGLNEYDPTDVQAEVLVFDHIKAQLIKEVIFPDYATIERYRDWIGNRNVRVQRLGTGFFASRKYIRKFGMQV